MIAVLVSNEDGVDPLWANAPLLHHGAKSFATEAGVYQNSAILGDEQAAVARAAATKDRELHGHRDRLSTSLISFSNTKSQELAEQERKCSHSRIACVFR